MPGVKTCGAQCQHPTCWASGKNEMIEAYKQMGLSQKGQAGYSHVSRPTDVERNESMHQQINFDNEEDSTEAALPTLKIVNVFENDEEQDYDDDHRSSAYVLHLYNSKRESTFPVSSAATRSSKLPKAPCASPSPSFASQYFKRQRRMVRKKWSFDEYKEGEGANSDMVQATNVKIQEKEIMAEEELTPTFVPYLVWIPSKKKKKRKKLKSAEANSRSNKISMKNITGSNSDFGFLPNDKDVLLRCYSRATHGVRSSPTKMHPKKLPPLPRDPSERLRSPRHQLDGNDSNEMLLSGNRLLRFNKETLPNKVATPIVMPLHTPHNTRASVRTRGNTQRKISEPPKEDCKIIENEDHDGLCILGNETYVIQHGPTAVDVRIERTQNLKDFTRYDGEARLHQKDAKEHREQRAELFLPRVTVPKDKLRKLPVDNHCKNSVPSHSLHDIQMQPVYGTDKTVSQISSASSRENASHLGEGDLNWTRESIEVEGLITEEEYVEIFETIVRDKRSQLGNQEGLYVNGEQDLLRAPAPTPASPRKVLEHVLSSQVDVIEVIREEQIHGDAGKNAGQQHNFEDETKPMVDPASETVSLAESRTANEVASKGSKAASSTISPVPSKASSGDWSSDKEFIKQTYDQYRSFTPFKIPGVSMLDARLESIREFSREQTCMTKRERSALLKGTPRANPMPFNTRIIPDFFPSESISKQVQAKAPTNKHSYHIPLALRSKTVQRRSHGDTALELSVSTMTPRQKQLKAKYAYDPPLSVQRMALQDPVTKQKHDYVSSYEIYEASVDKQTATAVTPIIIPIPHSTPCESVNEEDDKNVIIVKDENGTGDVITTDGDRKDTVITTDDDRKDTVIANDGDSKDTVITNDGDRKDTVITNDGDRKDTVITNTSNEAQDACANDRAAGFENSGKEPDEIAKENNFSHKEEAKLESQNRLSNVDQNSTDKEGMEDLKDADMGDDLASHERHFTSKTKAADISHSNEESSSEDLSSLMTLSAKPLMYAKLEDSYDREGMEDLKEAHMGDDVVNHERHFTSETNKADNSYSSEECDSDKSCSLITLTAKPLMYAELDDLTDVGSNFDTDIEHELSMDLSLNFFSDFSVNLDLSIDFDEVKNAMAELGDIDEKVE